MNDNLLSISQAAKYLGVSINTLRRWDESGKLKSVREKIGGNRYYRSFDLNIFKNDIFSQALKWVKLKNATEANLVDDFYCPNSAVFQARLQVLEKRLGQIADLNETYPLITSMVGEIGNNSFDHNLGNWRDVPGIFFGYDLSKSYVVLADRGQGVLKTLKRVKPELENDQQALRTAFTEIISGRAPEARGNGLKYVRNIISENDFELYFQSVGAQINLNKQSNDLNIKTADAPIRGCLALIKF
jgi:excisionase family DNA binding protein